ncbi:RNA polymerase sigma-I factor [Acetivibrio straminisolvens]|uniref:RNA polymerase sigma factor SigI n=1 Tax=Acetivibrio straminisolvens JCM 21531 TaxID=1294263 RepID=W4VBC3_9FIRM|nr:RNA polymerase sigma-I factor [Acetivibrio straminisolvens]GAE90492.1 RNA polymerase sigma-54 factor RpoN [Acetivibrio straminisolvens JCM 21531]
MDWHSQSINDDRERTKKIIIEFLNKIKAGDNSARDEFILRFKPFILKLVYKATDKHVEPENSEEYSVALLAFNEAINAYDEDKHPNFLVFSEQVINRRLIDYKRKNHKNKMVYPFSYFENENIKLERTLPDVDSSSAIERLEFTDEIRLFKSELASFNISFKDLLSCTPKHRDSRELLINIARKVAGNDGLYEKLRKTKKLPTLELLKLAKVSRRTIERNKKYIIAVSLILRSNLEIFREYAASSKEKEVDLR